MLHQSTLVVDDQPLHIRQSDGSGTPILFLHGTSSSSLAFERQLHSPVAEAHRLITLDLPGHGRSADAKDLDCYTIPSLANLVATVIDQMELDSLVIAGWSLGGHIAIELIEHPAVAGLMLSGTPPVGRGALAMLRGFRARLDLMLASKEVYTRRDVARFAAFCYPFGMTPEMLEDVRRADGRARPVIFSSMMQGQMSDQRQAVETNGKPVAIVNGRHDPFVRLGYLEGIGGLWRDGAKFIDGAGHAVFWDQPGVYNTLLMNFVADAVAARRRPALQRIAG